MLKESGYKLHPSIIGNVDQPQPAKAVIVGADDYTALASVQSACEYNLINPILIGTKDKIAKIIKKNFFEQLSGLDTIDIKEEQAQVQHAIDLVNQGKADFIIKGNVHTNALLKPIVNKSNHFLQSKRLSHIFQLSFPDHDQFLYLTDAVINIALDFELAQEVIKNSVSCLQTIGIEKPKVAFLSASEVEMNAMPSTVLATKLKDFFKQDQTLDFDGPLSLDLALSEKSRQIKKRALTFNSIPDLLVVPNIETGNIFFKTLVYFSTAVAAGIVLGAKCPIVLTSRADPIEARVASIILAIQANTQKK